MFRIDALITVVGRIPEKDRNCAGLCECLLRIDVHCVMLKEVELIINGSTENCGDSN